MRLKNIVAAIALSIAGLANAGPKYIFYFIGDGMGVGAVSLTQAYNRMVAESAEPLVMMQMPVASLAFTHSASSPVTDSAAAGTALATGNKTKNGMIGMTADSVPVTSIATQLHDMGYGVGLVTTVSPDDATPASFYAHQPYRGMYYEIGRDAASCGFEFLAGADLRGLTDKDGKPTDLESAFKDRGVSIVYGLDELSLTDGKRVVLLAKDPMSANELGFVVDSIEGQMSLYDMTEACLAHLEKNSDGRFFMMVEGGSIDHAGHSNDPATLVMETLGFDKALGLAMEFYKKHPQETLIVVTADHETGGLALANSRYHYNIEPKYLQYPRMSKDAFVIHLKSLLRSRMVIDWQMIKELLTDRLGFFRNIPVSAGEEISLQADVKTMLDARSEGKMKEAEHAAGNLANDVYKIVSGVSGAGWTTGDHSGAPVPVFAIGVGAERFSAMQDNTEIPVKILNIALDR